MDCTGTNRFQLNQLEERIAPTAGLLGLDLGLGASADVGVSADGSGAHVSADVGVGASVGLGSSLLGGLL